ncbi:unnamed protein product, partial [Cyprideis torosa]
FVFAFRDLLRIPVARPCSYLDILQEILSRLDSTGGGTPHAVNMLIDVWSEAVPHFKSSPKMFHTVTLTRMKNILEPDSVYPQDVLVKFILFVLDSWQNGSGILDDVITRDAVLMRAGDNMDLLHRYLIRNSKSLFLASAPEDLQMCIWRHFKNLLLQRLETSRNKVAGVHGCALLELIIHMAFRFSSLRYEIIAFIFGLASESKITSDVASRMLSSLHLLVSSEARMSCFLTRSSASIMRLFEACSSSGGMANFPFAVLLRMEVPPQDMEELRRIHRLFLLLDATSDHNADPRQAFQ